jgi:hypothetical protein
MAAMPPHPYPRLRWWALAWLAVYLPSYVIAYPLINFLFLCNLGVMLTAIGLLAGNQLLVSSQAVAAPVIGLVWTADVAWRLLTGDFLFGATAYMWEAKYPLFTRLLSTYHVFWPLLVLYCVKRAGYDRRGWPLQTAIAAAGITIARLATPAEENVNFAFADPFLGRQIGPPPVHVVAVVAIMGIVVYGATHWLLSRNCPETEPAGGA